MVTSNNQCIKIDFMSLIEEEVMHLRCNVHVLEELLQEEELNQMHICFFLEPLHNDTLVLNKHLTHLEQEADYYFRIS